MKKSTLKFSTGDRIVYVNSDMVHFAGTVTRADVKSHTPYDVKPDGERPLYHNVTADRLVRLTADTFFATRDNGNPDNAVFKVLTRAELFLVVGGTWYYPILEGSLSTRDYFMIVIHKGGETLRIQYFKP